MNTINTFNPLEPYYAAAFRTAVMSCLVNGVIQERELDAVKEAISKFKESEIEHSELSYSDKEELKHQWKLWFEATAQGIKDELRAEGKFV